MTTGAMCWRDRIKELQAQDTRIDEAPGGPMSEERETLRGLVARYEHDISTAREAGNEDLVDELLEPALEAQAMLDELDDQIIEHVTPTDVTLVTLGGKYPTPLTPEKV